MKKKILVIGGAGYIGSYVNKLLNLSGYETVILDNLSSGDTRSVTHGKLYIGDCGCEEDLEKVFTEHHIDGVMHFAAHLDVGESVKNPSKYYKNNVVKTYTLLEVMRKHGVNNFIFSSSAAIYGLPQKPLITEEHPKNPINPYGETKLIVEHLLRDYSSAYDLRYTSLRYFNAAGGDPDGEVKIYRNTQSNLIPRTLLSIMDPNGSLTIFGTDYNTPDGTCIRDYIHIHDLATAHILALEKLLEGGESTYYNLGNGKGFSVREVIESAHRVTGREITVLEGSRREGDPPFLVADSAKAQRELGWQPQYADIDVIIRDTWNVIRQQEASAVNPKVKKN